MIDGSILPQGFVWLILLSAWAAADTTAAFQFMVGQPLVAGWAAGFIVGQPDLGLFIGASLQMLWSRLAPVGATAYPDVGPATVSGVAVASLVTGAGVDWNGFFPAGGSALAVLAGLMTALATGHVGRWTTAALRRGNQRLAVAADAAAAVGSWSGVERANASGVGRSLVRGAFLLPAVLLVFGVVSRGAAAVSGDASVSTAGGGGLGPVLFWWIGLAALLSVLWRGDRKDWLVLAAGVVAAGLLRLAGVGS